MGAAELLRDLSGAGFALIAVDGKLLVTPASRLTDRLRDELRACKPQLIDLLTLQTHHSHPAEGCRCNDCRHLLPRGTCARPIEAGLITAAEGYGLAWPPEGHGFSCPAFEGQQAPPPAQERAYKLSAVEADAAHAQPWTEAQIRLFNARAVRCRSLGFTAADSDDLAERLHLRDATGDDRLVCLECAAFAGDLRCMEAARGRLPGASRRLEPVPTILQRCEGYTVAPGLA